MPGLWSCSFVAYSGQRIGSHGSGNQNHLHYYGQGLSWYEVGVGSGLGCMLWIIPFTELCRYGTVPPFSWPKPPPLPQGCWMDITLANVPWTCGTVAMYTQLYHIVNTISMTSSICVCLVSWGKFSVYSTGSNNGSLNSSIALITYNTQLKHKADS